MTTPVSSAPPLFFSDVVALTSTNHSETRFKREPNYLFASATNSIPLAISEFENAASHYPIVFTDTENPAAVAIMGFEADKNVFVDENGVWDSRSYIPAYIRKYPFLFMESEDGANYTLCIENANLSGDDSGELLFENGEPSQFIDQNLEFCKHFHAAWSLTSEFLSVLKDLDLLIARRADIQLPDGVNLSLDGFSMIDKEKYEQLPHKKINNLPLSVVSAIHCHFISMTRWNNLLLLHSK